MSAGETGAERALHLTRRDDGVAVLWIDDPRDSVNTLRRELADELTDLLDELEGGAMPVGLVVASAKPDVFIAGANLDMLRACASAAEARELAELSQRLQARLAALPVPTVAAIHGSCLGGGLEMVLALDARVASDAEVTRLGLPEVRLGLLPGGGGTQRLPRLIGVTAALDLMLSGREVRARQALAMGLVDAVVERSRLLDTAVARARALEALRRADGRAPVARAVDSLFTRRGFAHFVLARNPLGRRLLFARARRRTLARTRGNYPAPERILEVVRIGLAAGMARGLAAEAHAFGELVMSPESRRLVEIFFATRELKRDSGIDDADVHPAEVRRVGVLGGGLMGAGIALVTAARAELPVVLKERDAASLAAAMERVHGLVASRTRRSGGDADELLARISGASGFEALAGCDVIIEAVFEDLELKRGMLREVEALGGARVFASNTSSIPIADIAAGGARPGDVLGMHYFSPVPRMPLLEVIATPRTAPRAVATCVALGKAQGKTVIVVGDGPGFYTSRILAPYLNEAAWLLAEGHAIEVIDEALVDFGFPVGPLALLDAVGIDVATKVSTILHEAFGARMAPPPGLERLLAEGRTGEKSGRGFYLHRAGRGGARPDGSIYALLGLAAPADGAAGEALAERCVLAMVNEA
ncbi:MAG: 3-hydroxyacyl-CoA dehydrogenase NAD-binding domain-containing protein, partial [Gammaproteobacteria bacterium]|nr:3-hydroxyacyl-CoA dehydrogenase NAD-binding domain-containing protein [Gammaproteobacteria bacterium]